MTKPLEFFRYEKGQLSAQGVNLDDIATAVGTPAYVYNSEGFLSPFHKLKSALGDLDHMICFAVKSNSNLSILKLLSDAGAGMDLVSGGELFRARHAGVPAQKIVFSGVGKTPGEIALALDEGIFSFNVESVEELSCINEVAKSLGKVAKVAIRFNPDVDAKTHPYISTGLKKNKFGIPKSDLLAVAKTMDRFPYVRFEGLSVHIGSQLLSLSPLKDAFTKARDLIDVLDEILPNPISFVDLGGGIGITYFKEKTPSIAQYGQMIRKIFDGKRSRPLKVVIEPGRSIAGNAGLLLTSVLYRKARGKKQFLILDAAMNDLVRPALYGSYHSIVPVESSKGHGKKLPTDIVGPVCESSDCFASDRKIPISLQGGDLVAILSAGAYGFTMASQYNSRPRPVEIMIKDGHFHVIRERESYEDLIKGEVTQ